MNAASAVGENQVPKIIQSSPQLTVVMPVYNEQEALPGLLGSLIQRCAEKNWQLVLVDDGSTDGSALILDQAAAQSFVRVVHHKVNRGYGGALKTGILTVETPYLVTFDSDGQHSITDIEQLWKAACETKADLVIGNRGRSNHDKLRAAGKWVIKAFAGLLMTIPVKDLNSGFKLYRTELAQQYIHVCPDSMAFSDIITLVFIHRKNLVKEYPINTNPRQTGKSTINFSTGIDTVMEILNITLLFNPGRVFFPLSLSCMLFGILWGFPILLMGRGVSVGAMLAIVTSLIFFTVGLLANQLSAIRMNVLELRSTSNLDKK
jgi:glycosyltransferase involved in cell wall biosynthesis